MGSVGPVGMASVEPLSLKGATGDRGGRVGEDFNGSSGTVPTRGEALVRGRAGLELRKVERGGKQALSVPSPT